MARTSKPTCRIVFSAPNARSRGQTVKRTRAIVDTRWARRCSAASSTRLQSIDGKGPIQCPSASGSTQGARHYSAQIGQRADGNRLKAIDGYPDRPRPARADHRRPPDRKTGSARRHPHQKPLNATGDGRSSCIASTLHRAEASTVAPSSRCFESRGAGIFHHRRGHASDPRRCSTSRRTASPWASIPRHRMHAVIIYDDLSKQAWPTPDVVALRRRGREAYPATCLSAFAPLERAAKLTTIMARSLTRCRSSKPRPTTWSAYIPNNVISDTDGQIFLETDLFARHRPAVNVRPFGVAPSIVGETKAMKKVAGRSRANRTVREMAAFAQSAPISMRRRNACSPRLAAHRAAEAPKSRR